MPDKADIAQDYIEWRLQQALSARVAAGAASICSVDPYCVDCGGEIPAARRERLPGVRTCVPCQTRREGRR